MKKFSNSHTSKLKKAGIMAALIPHAGDKYAGDSRISALNYFKRAAKYIIYIATVHRLSNVNTTYILYKDGGIPLPSTFQLVDIPYKEHSFAWVHPQLKRKFPHAKIIALGPNKYNPAVTKWIISFMKRQIKYILLATTDGIHNREFYMVY